MKPLILEYKEKAINENFDISNLEYCDKQNLTVDKLSKKAAIGSLNMSTETFTKTYDEVSDSDHNQNSLLMGTLTQTHQQIEGTDDDSDLRMRIFMGTKTLTESQEVTDNDN